MMEEGMMTLLRKNVVSNARLLKCADGRGLRVSAPLINDVYSAACVSFLIISLC